MKLKIIFARAVGVGCFLLGGVANAALVNLGVGSFTPTASVITFSEAGYGLGTKDPVYTIGGNTISFGTYFTGQTVTGSNPKSLSGSPTGGSLELQQDEATSIVGDGANPTSPVLSGSPTFNGPISFMFSNPVAAVGLSGGFFDNVGSTTIEAFDVTGASLGKLANTIKGIEFYGLFDSTGSNIAGVSFYITGNELAGFAIDNVTFGDASVVVGNDVPEPATLALVSLGLAGIVARRRRNATSQ